MSRNRSGLIGAASLLAAVALVGTALPAAAADSAITVTGGSMEKITLSVRHGSNQDSTVEFGTNLTPDGVASDSSDTVSVFVDGVNDPELGACYSWDGIAQVRSNATYDLLVTSTNSVAELGFLSAAPTDYASCSAGEAASSTMFGLSGAWDTGLTRTRRRNTDFSLGLDVVWDADPDANLADTTLTITAQAS